MRMRLFRMWLIGVSRCFNPGDYHAVSSFFMGSDFVGSNLIA
jgi:hypothetical protein